VGKYRIMAYRGASHCAGRISAQYRMLVLQVLQIEAIGWPEATVFLPVHPGKTNFVVVQRPFCPQPNPPSYSRVGPWTTGITLYEILLLRAPGEGSLRQRRARRA
jgi:hypothetical protein